MENKIPKEIFFSKYLTAFLGKERVIQTEIRCEGGVNDIKYISEEYVNEILAEKDKEIEELKEKYYSEGYDFGYEEARFNYDQDNDEWINLFKNNSKEEILELLIGHKFPL